MGYHPYMVPMMAPFQVYIIFFIFFINDKLCLNQFAILSDKKK